MTFPIEKQTNHHRYKSIKFIYSHRHVSRTIDCYYYPYFSTIIEIPFPVNGKKDILRRILRFIIRRDERSRKNFGFEIIYANFAGGDSWWGGGGVFVVGRRRGERKKRNLRDLDKWLP